MTAPAPPVHQEHAELSPHLKEAIAGLEESAAVDPDALFLLAEMNFYGNFSHPRRPKQAFEYYHDLAVRDGNATAQYMLGLMYATGIGQAVEIDQSRAQLYYTFAAEQGELKAEMTLASRYHLGIATAKDCEKACAYYKKVADKAMKWWESGPPGGHLIQRNAYRWVEEVGGAYGEGASYTSSGPFAMDKNAIVGSFENVLEFLDTRERQGDYTASLAMGRHFYEPPRGYRRNLSRARRQFMKVAFSYWTRDGKVSAKAPKNIEKTAAKAAAYLGRMSLRGEGVEQNFERAITWFKRGVSQGDAFAQYHMGLMYRDGLGLPKDGMRAATYLKAAAEQGLGIAQSAIGVLFLDQGDLDAAMRYFELAKNAGQIEAYYYLAEMTNQGLSGQRNCQLATTLYKMVAERAEPLHSSFVEANSAFEKGEYERALLACLTAAEQGYEAAQANVAYLLDTQTSVISLPPLPIPIFANPLEPLQGSRRSRLLTNARLAQVYYTRSAHQSNIDSLIKAGDYHRLNIGTPTYPVSPPVHPNKTAAPTHLDAMYAAYSTAADHPNAAQALWNMGWMHEYGVGHVEKDFHMAKRYYDLALEQNKEAYLPVKLALLRLRVRSWWNRVSGGKVKSMDSDAAEEAAAKERRRPKSFSEWLYRFLDAAEEMDQQEYAALVAEQRHANGDFDPEAIGYQGAGEDGGAADYHYFSANARGAEAPDLPDDDFLGDIDDGLLESLIIVALAGALAMLVWIRQIRARDARNQGNRAVQPANQHAMEAQRTGPVREGVGIAEGEHLDANPNGQDERPPGPQGGFFPEPGDPEFQNWVVGGVGH